MKRFLGLLVLTFLVCCASAQTNALIVVSANAAKPKLDPAYAGHFETVLWPTAFTSSNQVLSLLSGLDWRGEVTDTIFRPAPRGAGFESPYYESLKQRGYLARRERWLNGEPVYALSRPSGAANPNVLLMALGASSNAVKPIAYNGFWPDRGVLVFEAESWGEAEDVATRCGGRALVLQLPNKDNGVWDSFFLRGRGWPPVGAGALPLDPSTGVAGLVRARNALSLLLHPTTFVWKDSPDSKDVVWRWFPNVRNAGLILLVIGMSLLACIIGFATYSIMIEQKAPLAAALLLTASLAPAAIMLLGSLERRFGLDNVVGFAIVVCLCLGLALSAVHGVVRLLLKEPHPLLACAVVGLIACLIGDAKWSFFSGIFGYDTSSYSPEATGVLVAYLTAVVAFSKPSFWVGKFAVLIVFTIGWLGQAWWAPDHWLAAVIPLIALVAGEGWFRWPWLFVLMFVPHPGSDVVRHGFAWSPLGCLSNLSGLGAVNGFDYFAVVVYPGVWAMALILLYVSIFGGKFVVSRLKLISRRDERMNALLWASAGLLAVGALYPALFPSAVFVAFGALIAFFHAAVWSL